MLAILLAVALVAWRFWAVEPGLDPLEPGSIAVETTLDAARYPSFLPPEAVATLAAIERGGPFRYDRDGSVFGNREGRLPQAPRGYYREYTVTTPGAADRGARRIVTGGNPPEVFYYTNDHYSSFRQFEVPR
jgi:guanyl-specific ribonuclease Sa